MTPEQVEHAIECGQIPAGVAALRVFPVLFVLALRGVPPPYRLPAPRDLRYSAEGWIRFGWEDFAPTTLFLRIAWKGRPRFIVSAPFIGTGTEDSPFHESAATCEEAAALFLSFTSFT